VGSSGLIFGEVVMNKSVPATERAVLLADSLMQKVATGELEDEQASYVVAALAMVVFATDQEWNDFAVGIESKKHTAADAAVTRFQMEFELEYFKRHGALPPRP
jgi:hypothetical protein